MSEEIAAEFNIEEPNINAEYSINDNSSINAEYNIANNEVVELEFDVADNNPIISEFNIADEEPIKTVFEIKAAGTVWGSITGEIPNQEDLQNALNEKADVSYVAEEINTLNSKIENKVETINGSDLIGVSREDNAVTITSKTFEFEQGIASATWVINHNLNKKPNIDVVDSNGSVQWPNDIIYNNSNKITVSFLAAFAGKAFLN